MSRMKVALIAVTLVIALFALACAAGMVGLRYPHVVEDEPLNAPIKVVRIDGETLILQDGRTMEYESWMEGRGTISEILSQSDFQVDLEPVNSSTYVVWARQDGWICGTPWAQPIRIPIFKDTVYRDRRQPIGRAREADAEQ